MLNEIIENEYIKHIEQLLYSQEPQNVSLALQLSQSMLPPNFLEDRFISKIKRINERLGDFNTKNVDTAQTNWWVEDITETQTLTFNQTNLNTDGEVEEFFDDLSIYKNLKKLFLANTKIKYIPDNINKLQSLLTFVIRDRNSIEYCSNEHLLQ